MTKLVWDDEVIPTKAPTTASPEGAAPKGSGGLVWADDEPGTDVEDVEVHTIPDGFTVEVLPHMTADYWRAVLRMRTEFTKGRIKRCKAPESTPKLTDDIWASAASLRTDHADRMQALRAWREAEGMAPNYIGG